MDNINLTENIIDIIISQISGEAASIMGNDLVSAVVYGSCARGDFGPDSDVDIALLTRCGRKESKKYNPALSMLAADIAIKYFQVVNFVCLPYDEFLEKKSWYPYFANIDREGKVIYG